MFNLFYLVWEKNFLLTTITDKMATKNMNKRVCEGNSGIGSVMSPSLLEAWMTLISPVSAHMKMWTL